MLYIGWTTAPDRQTADRLAGEGVRMRLAACAQVDGPITSHYEWEGKLERTEEWRVGFKFLDEEPLREWLVSVHPYQVPQWVSVRCEHVLPSYLDWARESTEKR